MDLLFGSFITPSAQAPDDVVALARVAEDAGLDLVTFQDHPYQPAFLDTWTLMSYVAAATSRIRLSGNVLNLPLRQPVVLARSAASLDLLSGGRVELGIGAGGFWDAIEAAGGRRLAPGEAVDALDEAIRIIRAVWDVGQRGGIRVDGKHYRVLGAKRGPAPAHDIGIWVGAYKPRMLRLVGRAADGWLPSLPYLPGGVKDLPALNAAIDEAALEAGRDPKAVRRMLNISGEFTRAATGFLAGPPDHWAEGLAELVREHGITAFILTSDEPAAIRTFGEEVAPAVRALLDAPATTDGTDAGAPHSQTLSQGPSGRGKARLRLNGFAAHNGALGGGEKDLVWDETTRPIAPPAPEGFVHSAHGRAVGQHLHEVHDHLRAELEQVRDVLQQVKRGAMTAGYARSVLNQMTMRQNNWTLGTYCAAYCTMITQHHGMEDSAIFPHLRRADAGLVPVIDRLQAEHVIIHEVVEGVDRALVKLIANPDDYTELEAAVGALTTSLLSHLSYEEEQITEPLSRYGFYAGQV